MSIIHGMNTPPLIRHLERLPRLLLIGGIRIYQRGISKWTPATCRFTPSCSEYAAQALEKYGAVRGTAMATLRLLRCHPFHPGGHDPVV